MTFKGDSKLSALRGVLARNYLSEIYLTYDVYQMYQDWAFVHKQEAEFAIKEICLYS